MRGAKGPFALPRLIRVEMMNHKGRVGGVELRLFGRWHRWIRPGWERLPPTHCRGCACRRGSEVATDP